MATSLAFKVAVASVCPLAVNVTLPVGEPNWELTVLVSVMAVRALAGFGATVSVVAVG